MIWLVGVPDCMFEPFVPQAKWAIVQEAFLRSAPPLSMFYFLPNDPLFSLK